MKKEALALCSKLSHYTLIKSGEHEGFFLYNPQYFNANDIRTEQFLILKNGFDYIYSEDVKDIDVLDLLTPYAKNLISAVG